MRREGSPFQGLGSVALKELADNLSSARMLVLELLIVLTALAALYGAIDSLRQNTAEDPFLLLRLFTVDRAPLPSFVAILGFLIPLMAIGLGFDAINSEHNRRTLQRREQKCAPPRKTRARGAAIPGRSRLFSRPSPYP